MPSECVTDWWQPVEAMAEFKVKLVLFVGSLCALIMFYGMEGSWWPTQEEWWDDGGRLLRLLLVIVVIRTLWGVWLRFTEVRFEIQHLSEYSSVLARVVPKRIIFALARQRVKWATFCSRWFCNCGVRVTLGRAEHSVQHNHRYLENCTCRIV